MLNETSRFIFEPRSYYGDLFAELRDKITRIQNKTDINTVFKLFNNLKEVFFNKNGRNVRYERSMTLEEKNHFKNALRYDLVLLSSKINLVESQDLKERINYLRNNIRVFLDNN